MSRLAVAVGLSLVAVFTLQGCGDDDDDGPTPDANAPASAASPPAPAPSTYAWVSGGFSECLPTCGPRADATRPAATCGGTTVPGGVQFATSNAALCTATQPATTQACATLAVDAPCDDGISDTTNDKCVTQDPTGCVGSVALGGQLQLPLDTSNLVLPGASATAAEVDASPIAAAAKTGIAAALTDVDVSQITVNGITVTTAGRMRRLSVDGIAVDYVIAVLQAVSSVIRAASTTMTVPDINIPAEANGGTALTVTSATIVTVVLKSFAWVHAAASCSAGCGTAAHTPNNTVTCQENSITLSASLESQCVPSLGAKPTSTTSCPATPACLGTEPPTPAPASAGNTASNSCHGASAEVMACNDAMTQGLAGSGTACDIVTTWVTCIKSAGDCCDDGAICSNMAMLETQYRALGCEISGCGVAGDSCPAPSPTPPPSNTGSCNDAAVQACNDGLQQGLSGSPGSACGVVTAWVTCVKNADCCADASVTSSMASLETQYRALGCEIGSCG